MNYIVVGSLAMSVAGLFLIYIAAANIEPEKLDIGSITGEFVGRTVTTEGYIKSEWVHKDGHLFLTVTDGKKDLQVPIFSNIMQYLNKKNFKQKLSIQVTGVVDEYRNQLQIIPRKPQDIVLGYRN